MRSNTKPVISTFLRRVLLADAAATGATAALMAFAAGPLAAFLGLPADLMRWAGFSLFPWVVLLLWLGTRERVSRPLVLAVVAGNALWAVDSVLLLMTGWVEPTVFGYIFAVAQALVVAAFAELQYVGLRPNTLSGGGRL